MRVLIDTATFLWMMAYPKRLSRQAHSILVDKPNTIRELSTLSLSEIAIKQYVSPGTFNLNEERIARALDEMRIHLLAYKATHAYGFLTLPWHHRDPFDRQIIAQAIAENIPVVTPDESFEKYPVKVIW